MVTSFLSLVPPLLVLFIGITTRRVLLALIYGIISAAAIASNFSPLSSIQLLAKRVWDVTDLQALSSWESLTHSDTLLITFFLCCLGVFVTLLEQSGATGAYTSFVRRKIHSQRQVESASLLLSLCLFVDDYFNALTVGTIMRPLTDHFKVPRAKLAFLVDSMAAPLSILIPVSSWVAVVLSQLQKAGLSSCPTTTTTIIADPFFTYLKVIPFILYSFAIMGAAWFIVLWRISFGPMRAHEQTAQATGNLSGGKETLKTETIVVSDENSSLFDFLFPISVFIGSVFCGLLYTGGSKLCGGSNSLLLSFRHADSSLSLAAGSFFCIVVSLLFLLARKRIYARNVTEHIANGLRLMGPAITVLLFSWVLGELLQNDLGTGAYLAQTLIGDVPPALFPAMLFMVASITSFAMGSSWGTVALVIPVAVPMTLTCLGITQVVALQEVPIILPVLGAILSGAVLGDHISPISDTTIMTSTSTGCYHMDHVSTQFYYAGIPFLGTLIGFLIAGIMVPYGIIASSTGALLSALCTTIFLLVCIARFGQKHAS